MIRQLKTGQTAESKAENSAQVRSTVETILSDIAARGEAAVREYSEKFDKWSPTSFRISESEIAECVGALPQGVIDDIKFAQTQIRNFALTQRAALYAQRKAKCKDLAAAYTAWLRQDPGPRTSPAAQMLDDSTVELALRAESDLIGCSEGLAKYTKNATITKSATNTSSTRPKPSTIC